MHIYPFLLAEVQEQLPAVTEKGGKVLTGTEKMDGTQIAAMTIVGLTVVFSALLILVIFLYCSGGIFKKTGKQKKTAAPAPAPKKTAAPPVKPLPKKEPVSVAEDDSEIVAAIMAAIAAMGAADGKNYRLRSVRQVTRTGSGRTVWAQAGLSDATRPFA
ncbi:MAG: OadG family protein [Oscillospiraceae bacterium]|nr:OadG family protein [Oscillospiraceae bacterium]